MIAIEQNVVVPSDRRLSIQLPPDIPVGPNRLIFVIADAPVGQELPLNRKAATAEMNRIRQAVESLDQYPSGTQVASLTMESLLLETERQCAGTPQAEEWRHMRERLPVLNAFFASLPEVENVGRMRDEWDASRG
jgi:hypothetical protein